MPKKNKIIETINPEKETPEFFSQKVADPTPPQNITPRKAGSTLKTRDIKKQIASIYENAEPLSPLPQKGSKKTKILTFIIFILAFLAAVSWTGFFMFGRGSSFDENKINLSARVETVPVVGKEFSYQVTIKNAGQVDLNTVTLNLRYPQGFEFTSAEPVSSGSDNKEWQLGTLAAGQNTKINIKGTIWDNALNDTNLQMVLSYRPGDLNAELFFRASAKIKLYFPGSIDLTSAILML